ncbi:MAG: EamA family transporter RarD [Eggerthellaceae bacterium]|nr:EamA family transporter RarD [Eggerthellaceae bacterium]
MSNSIDNGDAASTQAGLTAEERRGVLSGALCYVFWGLCPLFWKLLEEVDSFEIIAQRIIWCFVTVAIVCAIAKLDVGSLLRDRRAWRYLVPSALLITVNWSIYIYAVNSGNVVETAIGYYINPLVSIVLGLVLFRERLTRLQGIAVALCVFGIVFFTVNYGRFPWIAVALAITFGLYGAVKKKAGYPATTALAFESGVMLIPSIVFAVVLAQVTGTHAFLGDTATLHGWFITALLVLAGPVTAVPLLLFANAANKIPLSLLGFLQYISPTIALITGVFLFGEPFTIAHAVCLGSIWCGLALVGFETIRASK